MTPEHWRQIEELYHSAREHGRGVLADTDPELRREVERLLAQDSEGKILDRPAVELLEEFTATDARQSGHWVSPARRSPTTRFMENRRRRHGGRVQSIRHEARPAGRAEIPAAASVATTTN